MNEIINKFLLAGDKFMPEMHNNQDLVIVPVDHLLKTMKELKDLKKQEIQARLLFNIIWLKGFLKI